MKATTSCRFKAMNLLSRREYSRFELESRLKEYYEQDLLAKVLDDLAVEGLQSDERFIANYVRTKVNNQQGPQKIEYELRSKGVSMSRVAQELGLYSDQWFENAKALLLKKYGDTSPENHKERQKRQRFIASRGFANDTCYRLFND